MRGTGEGGGRGVTRKNGKIKAKKSGTAVGYVRGGGMEVDRRGGEAMSRWKAEQGGGGGVGAGAIERCMTQLCRGGGAARRVRTRGACAGVESAVSDSEADTLGPSAMQSTHPF